MAQRQSDSIVQHHQPLPQRAPAQGFSLSSLLSSASIFHGQVQKAADYLASPLLGVTALLHIGHVVTGRHQDILSSYDGCPVHGLPGTSSDIPFLYIPTAAWHRSDSAWHSSENCCTVAMTIIFRSPQNKPVKAVWGIFCYHIQRYKKIITLAIKSLDLFGQFYDNPNLY